MPAMENAGRRKRAKIEVGVARFNTYLIFEKKGKSQLVHDAIIIT
jgi:hypothetical protein